MLYQIGISLALLVVLVHAQTVTVQSGTTFQTMDGFGFAEAFGHAKDLFNYPASQQKQVLDLLFDTNVGAGMTIIRNRIGSGGVGDSILPTSPGCPTCTPKYVWDGTDGQQVWFSQQAMKYGVKTIYADAWSAPGFMKTTGTDGNGGLLCGVTGASCSSGDWKQAYANFLTQYIKLYQQAGVPVTHVGFLNEPEFTPTYSSMNSNGQQAADFIKVLAPTLAAANLTTKITCCDSEGWNNQVTMTAAINSAGALGLLGVVTSHSYTSSPSTNLINTTHNVWQTEYADLSGALLPNNWFSSGAAGEGLTWANRIFDGIVNARLSAYLYWIGAEPGTTNSALILTSGTAVTASKRLWAFAQWSRYVRPGAVRLGTSLTTSGSLKFSAFKNPDGSTSVQAINNGASAANVVVSASGFTISKAAAFVSAQNTDLAPLPVTLSGGSARASVPAHAMVTFLLNGATGSGGTTTTVVTTSPPSTTPATTTTTTTTTPPTGCVSAEWGQCGGQGWTGCLACDSGTTCTQLNPFFFQCIPPF
ncbi:Glycoside hydrolase [Mycena kentingensis (nom. inval.)]|nr:Glycoside hydrolase [Mycena kentingensis (nom. inval.)]